MKVKVYVCGSIQGDLIRLLGRLWKLHDAQEQNTGQGLSLCIVIGDLFEDPLVEDVKHDFSGINFPIPVYFTKGRYDLPRDIRLRLDISDSNDVHTNLTYLPSGEVLTTEDGIRIGVYSPTSRPTAAPTKTLNYNDDPDVVNTSNSSTLQAAAPQTRPLDILLTPTCWPPQLRNNPDDDPQVPIDPKALDLIKACLPRYVLSGAHRAFYFQKSFYQTYNRTPDSHHLHRITWFESFAEVGNTRKAKAEYCFNYDQNVVDFTDRPEKIPRAPWEGVYQPRVNAPPKRPYESEPGARRIHGGLAGPKRMKPNKDPYDRAQCFLCLDNSAAQEHLVVDVGEQVYCTVAKGPLTPRTPAPTLLPTHYILTPIVHASSIAALPDPSSRASTLVELHQYRHRIAHLLTTASSASLATITLELARPRIPHILWQVIGVPSRLVTSGVVEQTFRNDARSLGLAFSDPPSANTQSSSADKVDDGDGDETFTLYISPPPSIREIIGTGAAPNGKSPAQPGSGKEVVLKMKLNPDEFFPAQFGRAVLAGLLNKREREHWQMCDEGFEAETAGAEAAKVAFEKLRKEGESGEGAMESVRAARLDVGSTV